MNSPSDSALAHKVFFGTEVGIQQDPGEDDHSQKCCFWYTRHSLIKCACVRKDRIGIGWKIIVVVGNDVVHGDKSQHDVFWYMKLFWYVPKETNSYAPYDIRSHDMCPI